MLQIFFPGDNAAEFLMDTMKLQVATVLLPLPRSLLQ